MTVVNELLIEIALLMKHIVSGCLQTKTKPNCDVVLVIHFTVMYVRSYIGNNKGEHFSYDVGCGM